MWEEACLQTDGTHNLASFKAGCVDLICAAYFFAMHSCEYTNVDNCGKTKPLTIGNIVFRRDDDRQTEVSPLSKSFATEACFVTITFVDQKSGKKMESCTQL